MAAGRFQGVISYLRRAVAPDDCAGASDAQLLHRFAQHDDGPAFELLVWRHARTVLGACGRVLRDEHRIEDCFQAAFLALAKEARSIGRRESVGGWLHKVAFRLALKAKASAAKWPVGDRPLEEVATASGRPEPWEEAAWRELAPILDGLVRRLPDKYREAFILRCLAGKSSSEAAGELGCPVGAVESGLLRAREWLRAALARRGFALPTGRPACGLLLEATAAGSAIPVGDAVRAAARAARRGTVAGAASPRSSPWCNGSRGGR
jgi:RNA polymerase sigma factor (sigma-70 family)